MSVVRESTNLINHPGHYNVGEIECIDAVESWDLSFNLGNAVKYICRCNYKGNKELDLKKAIWYISREMKRKEEVIDPKKYSEYSGATWA